MSISLFAEDGAPLPALPLPPEPLESVLWYGEPDVRLILRWGHWRFMLFGTLGLGLALAMLIGLRGAALAWWQETGQWALVLIFIGGSAALWVIPPLTDRDHRRRKRYWLTNRRAIVQNDPRARGAHALRDLDALRAAGFWVTHLSPTLPLRRVHRTVRFAWHQTRYQEYRYKDGVGFDRIDAAPRLHALMRRLIDTTEAPP